MAALGKAVRSAVSSGRHEMTKGMRKTRSIGQDIEWWWKVNEVQIPGTKNALYRAFLDSLLLLYSPDVRSLALLSYDAETQTLVGPAGALPVLGDDEISQKLLRLIEGQCSPLGPKQAAEKFGFTKQRSSQLLKV